MDTIGLETLRIFLDSHWHQMSDAIYSDISDAVREFIKQFPNLKLDLCRDFSSAQRMGLFGVDWQDKVYDGDFWSQFDRLINLSQSNEAINTLRNL